MSKISVAYIVKDEILKLPYSYKMTKELADEIVIVDTGSKDGTWQWAKSRNVVFARQKWDNDYAKARNHSLSLCTKPWILVLDADEHISAMYFGEIRKLVNTPQAYDSFQFTIWNFLEDPRANKTKPLYGVGIRLFRNLPSIKYEGCIHNQLVGCKNTHFAKDIAVNHFQFYEREYYKEKAAVNLKLLAKKVKQQGWNFLNCVHHGDIYRRLYIWYYDPRDLVTAIDYFERALTFKKNVTIQQNLIKCRELLDANHKDFKLQAS